MDDVIYDGEGNIVGIEENPISEFDTIEDIPTEDETDNAEMKYKKLRGNNEN